MKFGIVIAFTLAVAATGPLRAEPPADADSAADRELQIGGSVALDQNSRLDAQEDPRMQLHEVALGANVALEGGIEAAVVLKAEDDLAAIFFDQATATLTPPGARWSLIVGQQAYNHGLLTTRLISDPEILPYLEVKQPGLSATWAPGELSLGMGLVLLETGDESAPSRDFTALPNVDWNHGPWQARLSGMASRFRSDLDLATSLTAGPLVFDIEGFSRLRVWDSTDKTAGYSLGAECSLPHGLSAAVRHDGIAPHAGAALSA